MPRHPLSAEQCNAALASLPGWSFSGSALTREYALKSFPDAMAFMLRVAFHADRLDHHPAWKNLYNRVWVELSTHDANAVTGLDVELARLMDAEATGFLAAPP
jgi:4a-hydroxytetrahydrobiopterin dehydratase